MHSIGFLLRATEPKISTKNTENMSLYKPKAVHAASERQYTAVGGDVQVPSGGIYEWRKAERQEIDTTIGKASAVLREFYRSVGTKRELSNTAKLLVFESILVPILTYGHKSWVMTERILTQVQAPKLAFLRRVHGVTKWRTDITLRSGQVTTSAPPYLNLRHFGSKCTALTIKLATLLRLFGAPQWFGARGPPRYAPGVTLRGKVHSCEIRRALNIEPLLLLERTQLR